MLRGIGRIVWSAIAFVLAVVAGLAMLGFVGLERLTAAMHDGREAPSEIGQWVDLANVILGLSEWGAALSVVPALMAVVVGELARIRSLVYWVAAGGMAAVAAPVMKGMAVSPVEMILPATALMPILATAGFAGGVVYWALAGRTS